MTEPSTRPHPTIGEHADVVVSLARITHAVGGTAASH
jgi:hypothetical protein